MNDAPLHYQVRRLTTSRKWQQIESDTSRDHKERLAVLQAEDIRLLKPAKAKLKDFVATVDKARDLLENMPAALQPILPPRSVHTFAKHQAVIAQALARAEKLKDERLHNLLAHLEDLEVEDYPEPGNDESELRFLARVKDMNPVERQAFLDRINMEVDTTALGLREGIQSSTREQEEAETSEQERLPIRNPLPSPSTEEQFASVVSDATTNSNVGLEQQGDVTRREPTVPPGSTSSKTPAPESQSTASAPKPNSFGFDLNSLQAKLEASIKKAAKG
jgi:hypothetical protein